MTPSTEHGQIERDAASEHDELQRLRARVSELERELVDTQARTDASIGYWQERAYWLDRWHVDLNALMRKPGASEFRAALRAVRAVIRTFKRAKRRLSQS